MHIASFLHSVSYSGGWGQARLTVDEFVDKAASLGYEGVLLMAKRPHLSLLDYGPAERLALRKRVDAHGVRVAIASYNNFTADWRAVERALKECALRAADMGVTIGVQNHHDIAVGYESHYDLTRAVGEPNCKALFDAWAPALHGDDLCTAAQLMAPITVHTTIANYQLPPRYRYNPALVNYTKATPSVEAVPVDEGFIDYRAFLTAMGDSGFRGSVAYEMCSPLRGGGSIETWTLTLSVSSSFFRASTRSLVPAFCVRGENSALNQ
jgi:sugar phosphate isomerase/epimerase